MTAFEEYLIQKRIDPVAFKHGEANRWQEFSYLFEQLHPDSFTAQKLFLINAIRRKYPLKEDTAEEKVVTKAKPKVKIPAKRKTSD